MSSKKITLPFIDDFESDFHLLALHSTLEDFRLAFHLNKTLSLFFQRDEKYKICINENELNVPRYYFCYEDKYEYIDYFLIENKHLYSQKNDQDGFFANDEINTQTYFIENDKKANYILIIKGESIDDKISKIINQLKNEKFIQTIYNLSTDKIKNKYYYNLIA